MWGALTDDLSVSSEITAGSKLKTQKLAKDVQWQAGLMPVVQEVQGRGRNLCPCSLSLQSFGLLRRVYLGSFFFVAREC